MNFKKNLGVEKYVKDLKMWKEQFEKRIIWIDKELKEIEDLEK